MMLVNEVLSKITEMKSSGDLSGQMVEFIIGGQKYFNQNLKVGTNTMEIEVSRDNYHPLLIEDFTKALSQAGKDLEAKIICLDKKTEFKVEGLFLSQNFLEILTDVPD